MTHTGTAAPFSATADLAIDVIRAQGRRGKVTELAEELGVERRRLYDVLDRAEAALESEFGDETGAEDVACSDAELTELADDRVLFHLPITVGHLKRAVVALRVVAPCSIRDIVALLPILFGPLASWSYGKIQAILVEAGRRAAEFLRTIDLSNVDCAALDEMFSQGSPVLGGLDVVTQFVFLGSCDLSVGRTARPGDRLNVGRPAMVISAPDAALR